jgi:superfamily II DNA/RNA helicase
MLFSATMPRAIAELASRMLRDPAQVAVSPVASTVELIEQRVIHVDAGAKHAVLIELLRDEATDRALVFTRTKHRADVVVRRLVAAGIAAEAIHGNKSQNNRDRALAGFRDGRLRTLVATDIAARGIDVDGITHVVNFDLPHVAETYVHRIGRTGRAGANGMAVSLCDAEEVSLLRDIEKLIRKTIAANHQHSATHSAPPPARHAPGKAKRRPRPAHPSRAQRNDRNGRAAIAHPHENGTAGAATRGGNGNGRQHFRKRRRRKQAPFGQASAERAHMGDR